ncbi:MAG: hypothetical protein P8I78_01650 [Flavobacterium sp.]|uniref:hypothetical protein n=1 Tax=Flavobacterium frigidarium TaxID=99286 RepID=UPI0030DB5A90|nr:hypothetical protein [Flavobacterium sp.]|tara:strand:- start:59 stop:292 length:234 start_codon:yes stop_codon:yes gene_type:complete
MFKNIKLQVIFFGALFLSSGVSHAQCAMCRAALGGESNNAQAQAVNDGIVYLMAIPYVLVGIIGYAVYRLYRKKKVS